MHPCANCDQPTDRKPFCSEDCKMVADNVRMMRQWVRNPDKQADTGYIDAFVPRLGKLYSVAIGLTYGVHQAVTGQLRTHIMERDDYKCQIQIPGVCTVQATQVDHINGPTMEPSNLQASCRPCNMNKVIDFFGKATDEEAEKITVFQRHLAERIDSEKPTRICDDEQNWRFVWRKYPNTPDVAYTSVTANLRFDDIRKRSGQRRREMHRDRRMLEE
jgi:hypothetical protein